MNKFILQVSADIILRLMTKEDAQVQFDSIQKNREFLRKYLNWVDKVENIQNTLDKIQLDHENFKKGESLELGIFYKEQFVGRVGFHEITKHAAEIGYWLDEEFNGLGIITQSVEKITEYGIHTLKKHRIVIKMDINNFPSKSIPKRLGFTYEGTERESSRALNGNWRSTEVWSFIESDEFIK
jgi:ribosomal-protein-serine acetyltransferase